MGVYTHVSFYLMYILFIYVMELVMINVYIVVVCMCVHLSVSVTCTMYRLLVVFIVVLESAVSLILGEH